MIKNVGLIFSGLLILLLLSNIHYNTGFQVLGQNNTLTVNNSAQTAISPTTPDTTATSPISTSTPDKLAGGIKIISPGKDDLVPTNSNKSLIIYGVSKDNATTDCDVTIIVNNVKPYQNVQPTGIQGNEDYSTWQYTLTSNYTTIKEGSNKITSKIFCAAGIDNGGTNGSQSASQAYYSVNVTGSNFTQAQLANYELMLESAANSTNGGNSTLASSGAIQPVAQIQQFNQDTGNGPVCCAAIPGQATGTTSPTTAATLADDTTEVATNEDKEEIEEEEIEEESNEEIEEEESNSNKDEEKDDEENDDNDSSRDIMDEIEDTLRKSGIDMDL